MQSSHQTLAALFGQLGLPDDQSAIQAFIETHRTNDSQKRLEDLPVWTDSQKQFLLEARSDDAEWAVPVDELDALIHQQT